MIVQQTVTAVLTQNKLSGTLGRVTEIVPADKFSFSVDADLNLIVEVNTNGNS